eukprot:SAG11_NODE_14906_length_595_cov_1.453629_1_plen_52_part_10
MYVLYCHKFSVEDEFCGTLALALNHWQATAVALSISRSIMAVCATLAALLLL